MAGVADKYTIIRSVAHRTPDHPAATYWMIVGSPIQRATPQTTTMSREDRPHPGSVLAKLLPAPPALPAFVMVPEAISPVGPERPGQFAGFLGAAYDPYRVNSDPNLASYSPGALTPAQEVNLRRLEDRRELLDQIGRQAKLPRANCGSRGLLIRNMCGPLTSSPPLLPSGHLTSTRSRRDPRPLWPARLRSIGSACSPLGRSRRSLGARQLGTAR